MQGLGALILIIVVLMWFKGRAAAEPTPPVEPGAIYMAWQEMPDTVPSGAVRHFSVVVFNDTANTFSGSFKRTLVQPTKALTLSTISVSIPALSSKLVEWDIGFRAGAGTYIMIAELNGLRLEHSITVA